MSQVALQELVEIFGEVIDLSGIQINKRAVLGEDIPVDSGEMLQILSRIESRYKFRFDPRDILGLKTLGDVMTIVQHRTKIS
jgi:acyl carrier protein